MPPIRQPCVHLVLKRGGQLVKPGLDDIFGDTGSGHQVAHDGAVGASGEGEGVDRPGGAVDALQRGAHRVPPGAVRPEQRAVDVEEYQVPKCHSAPSDSPR